MKTYYPLLRIALYINEKPDAAMIEKQEVIEWVKSPQSTKVMRN